MPKHSHNDYTIGWICALPLEMAASKAMLDEIHPRLPQPPTDTNIYTLGAIHGHNVVIACLPSGVYGTSSATLVATQMMSTFQSIRFGLMVGIGGGVPSKTTDIRLGDVVVSKPTPGFGGVVQYDYGKAMRDGRFHRTGTLNKPPPILLCAIADLEAEHVIRSSRIPAYLSDMRRKYPFLSKFNHPGPEQDRLFNGSYNHVNSPTGTCNTCSANKLVPRLPRYSSNPHIHYGLIASGNQVMKDGVLRDRLRAEMGDEILCFEMEAAGLMDHFPCLVIRGICDYSDSHKNKQWQGYAAAVAAAYAKELLSVVPVTEVPKISVASDAVAESKRYHPVNKVYQGETVFHGPISHNAGVIMGNINSSGKEGVHLTGSSQNYHYSS